MTDFPQYPSAPLDAGDPAEHRRRIAVAANAAVAGKTNNVGEITLTENSATTTLTDPRLTYFSVVIFDPLTANAIAAASGGKSNKFWAFSSPNGTSGTFYWGGFYSHSGTSNDFSGGPTWGTANASYAAHFFVVLGAATVDELTLRVTGTSINDSGTRATSDTEDIVIPNSTSPNAYYETSKKWLGQVTITVVSGTAKVCDYGWSKYWDNGNSSFTVVGLEATWLGGANDTAPNIELLHHKTTGWTYTGSGATPPAALAAMATDHSTEDNVRLNEDGAWKRTNLSTSVDGAGSEGVLFRVTTGANAAFRTGTLQLDITTPGLTITTANRNNGSLTITHANNAQTDRTFRYAIIG